MDPKSYSWLQGRSINVQAKVTKNAMNSANKNQFSLFECIIHLFIAEQM
jgi:hypothetical protein